MRNTSIIWWSKIIVYQTPGEIRSELAAMGMKAAFPVWRRGGKLARAPKGSNERARKRKMVARRHERIANRRKNVIEQETRRLVARFGVIAVEALIVRNMH
jgi:hypothetical protein